MSGNVAVPTTTTLGAAAPNTSAAQAPNVRPRSDRVARWVPAVTVVVMALVSAVLIVWDVAGPMWAVGTALVLALAGVLVCLIAAGRLRSSFARRNGRSAARSSRRTAGWRGALPRLLGGDVRGSSRPRRLSREPGARVNSRGRMHNSGGDTRRARISGRSHRLESANRSRAGTTGTKTSRTAADTGISGAPGKVAARTAGLVRRGIAAWRGLDDSQQDSADEIGSDASGDDTNTKHDLDCYVPRQTKGETMPANTSGNADSGEDLSFYGWGKRLPRFAPKIEAVAHGLERLAKEAEEDQPANTALSDSISEVVRMLRSAQAEAQQWHGLFTQHHDHDIARVEEPRKGSHRVESRADVGQALHDL